VRVGLYFADPGIMAWTSRTPDQVAAFGDRLTAVVRRIRAREFPARPAEGRCRWCEYRTTCVASAAGGSRETAPGAGAIAASEDHPGTLGLVTLDDRLAQAAEREGFPAVSPAS
jgi:hypothetical protein